MHALSTQWRQGLQGSSWWNHPAIVSLKGRRNPVCSVLLHTIPIEGLSSCCRLSGFVSPSQRIRRLCFTPCTEPWVDMENLRGWRHPRLWPAMLGCVLQNSLPVLHTRCKWERHCHEESRKSSVQEGNRERVVITTDLRAKFVPLESARLSRCLLCMSEGCFLSPTLS